MPFNFLRSKAARKKRREPWQQVSLVAGFLAGRHFVGAKDLHYGYWTDDIETTIRNLPLAQDAYSKFFLSHVPTDTKKILDVGSGAGGIASKLMARGHQVDCVSPSTFLNEQARQLLGDKARIYDCTFEDFKSTEIYDAVIFCESFQYVHIEQGLEKVCSLLRPGGALVICDFYRRRGDVKSPISGGHYIDKFQSIYAKYPLRLIEDIDITEQTAKTFTVIDSAFTVVLQPIWAELDVASKKTWPILTRFGKWMFRNRLAKFENKYFTHERSAENFTKHKTYRMMRFERT